MWEKIQRIIEAPVQAGDVQLHARVEFLNDARYRDLDAKGILALLGRNYSHTFVMLVDNETLTHPEMPLLVMDLWQNRGQTFRAVPGQIQTIENNLSIANVDFADFVAALDKDGIYRGAR